jgi:hypothetical protein
MSTTVRPVMDVSTTVATTGAGIIGQITDDQNGTLKVNTGNGWMPITNGGNSTITTTNTGTIGISGINPSVWQPSNEHILEKFEMNQVVVEHKVAEHELLKLKADQPDYAEHIKQNLTKNATTQIVNKMTFTKKRDINTDVNHFIGRVWVFNKDEMETLINEIRNA